MPREPKQLTSYPGVRYRDHAKRKHGIKPDRYFFIRYKLEGKDKEEGVGWASAGMTAEKANKILAEIRENLLKGTGPRTLEEQREQNEAKRLADEKAKEEAERRNVPFGSFFDKQYMPVQEVKKVSGSIVAEKNLYTKWIKPILKNVSLPDITVAHIEKLAVSMKKAGKSPSTIKYAIAVVSQVWNFARDREIVDRESPTRRFKKPKLDNKRVRYLTEAEARLLLDTLWKRSTDVHDMTLFSLFSGARASEIYGLRWADVNIEQGTIYLRDTKAKVARHVYITQEMREVITRRYEGQGRNELLFPSRKGTAVARISNTFEHVVAELGFNEGVADIRQKVVFHTLRHTFASWLAQRAVPLYTIAKLTGHSELRMVERYAHLAPDGVKEAAMLLEGAMTSKDEAMPVNQPS